MGIFKTLVALGAFAYVVALGGLYIFQRPLLYLNYGGPGDPGEAGFPEASVFRIRTDDDETLLAWYVAPAKGRMLALYFHGNGGPLAVRGPVLRALTTHGMGVLAIDYRGFGGSSGTPTEAGLHLDADAAYAKALQLGHAARDILLVGESLGSGVAVHLATRRAAAGLVLDSPFSSAVDVAADRYWMFPVSLLMQDRFRSDERIAHVRAPLLIMHGEADRVIPLRFGEKLHGLAGEPKEFLRIANARHTVLSRPEAIEKLRDWAARLEQIDKL